MSSYKKDEVLDMVKRVQRCATCKSVGSCYSCKEPKYDLNQVAEMLLEYAAMQQE